MADNITGGAGVTGSAHVANASAGGYTVRLTGSTDVGGPMVFRNTPFDLDSFEYIGGVYSTPTWVPSHKDSGFTDFEQVLDQAKAEPDSLTLGIGGKGGAHHVMAEAIVAEGEAPMRIICYDGGAALKKAVIANEVDVAVIHSPVLLAEVGMASSTSSPPATASRTSSTSPSGARPPSKSLASMPKSA